MTTAAELFARVLEQPAHRQDAFLLRCTRKEPVLREEVQSLLRANRDAAGFLDSSPEPLSEALAEPLTTAVPGHRLIQKIGEGGSGTVHLAREEGSLRRNVAVKFLKRDGLSSSALERFDFERSVLATLQHQGIAKIFRAGTTEIGCPYYTMEWVDGQPIDTYANRRTLPVRTRVELFLEVCVAVAHAHQRGVIHGDVKPSNVLVSDVDGAPCPKLIDFGIAQVIGTDPVDATTTFGTLRSMSPEQRRGATPDTRCDIYALGVLLRWLLLGPPEGPSNGLSLIQGYEALSEDDRAALAGSRSTSAGRLWRALHGDLDHIVRKATSPDPKDRYQTVQALEQDLRATLGHRPLPSRPTRPGEILRKLVRRNPLGTIATLLALATGAVLLERTGRLESMNEAAAARENRAEADRRAWQDAADTTLRFFDQVFEQAAPDRPSGPATVRHLIDTAEEQFENTQPAVPLVRARIALSLGRIRARLLQYEKAIPLLREAHALLAEALPEDSRELAYLRIDFAQSIAASGHTDESRSLLKQALETLSEIAGEPRAFDARGSLAFAKLHSGDFTTAREELRQTYEDARRELGDDHAVTHSLGLGLSQVEQEFGDIEQARALIERHLDSIANDPQASLRRMVELRVAEASNLHRQGRLDEAEVELDGALADLSEANIQAPTQQHSSILLNQAKIAQSRRDAKRTLELFAEIVDMQSDLYGAEAPQTLNAATNLAAMLLNFRRLPDAQAILDEHDAAAAKLGGYDHAMFLRLKARALELQQKGSEALPIHDQILAILTEEFDNGHPIVLGSRRMRVVALSQTGQHDEAMAELEAIRATAENAFGEAHPEVVSTVSMLAFERARGGDQAAAEAELETILRLALEVHGPSHSSVQTAIGGVENLAGSTGNEDFRRRMQELLLSDLDERIASEPARPEWQSLRAAFSRRFGQPPR